MTATVWFLFLILYPACGDAVYEQKAGPFADQEVCEQYKAHVLKHQGPPAPGSVMECRQR